MPKTATQTAPKSETKKTKKVDTPVEVDTPEETEATPTPTPTPTPKTKKVATTDTTPEKKTRTVASRDTILETLDEIITSIEEEITRIQEDPAKPKGMKFLRTLNKRVNSVRSQSARVMKVKNATPRKTNENSGFRKPVLISEELAKFTGWDASVPRSRIEVTRSICDYIKEHDLQNPEDRRKINPDPKLQKLLGYNPKKMTEPLRYYSLQTYLKPHFLKVEDTPSA